MDLQRKKKTFEIKIYVDRNRDHIYWKQINISKPKKSQPFKD